MISSRPTIDVFKRQMSTSVSNLPYEAQYHILVEAQHFLEEACFEFARNYLPSILRGNEWDCAEAVELNLFVKELGGCRQELAPIMKATMELSTGKLLTSIADIRHAAVHRHRLSASGIDQIFQDGEHFLTSLGDCRRLERMKALRRDAYNTLAKLDRDE